MRLFLGFVFSLSLFPIFLNQAPLKASASPYTQKFETVEKKTL